MAEPRCFLKKGDSLLLAAVGAAAVLLLLLTRWLHPTLANGVAEITVDGTVYGVYALDETRTLTLESADGGYNRIEFGDGGVTITDADCPDRLCMRRGTVSRRGEAIVCLPHRLVITVRQGGDNPVDFISG